MPNDGRRSRWILWPLRLLLLVPLLLIGPIGVLVFGNLDLNTHWSKASMASSGRAPAPSDEPASMVQVYGARAYNWRGAFGIHTWIATKRQDARYYRVYQVIGWNLYRGSSAVSVNRVEQPDFSWFNAQPELLVERRGCGVDALIDRIETAVTEYPTPTSTGFGRVPTATASPPMLLARCPSSVWTYRPRQSERTT